MNLDAWLPAFHIVGVIAWIAGLTGGLALLAVHARAPEPARAALVAAERTLGIVMDAGATAAIAFGLWIAIKWHEFGHGAWLHIKLTAVVVGVLSTHGFVRMRMRKFRNGTITPVPAFWWALLAIGVVTAAVFGANLTLMRS